MNNKDSPTSLMKKKEWFDEWFNTFYYHILYKNRDHQEASQFLDKLIAYFNILKNSEILDLACGKGRHSIYLNKKGYQVTGVDLSQENIKFAKKHENEKLTFDVHDMRNVYSIEQFDYVFNLFTSFGYFDSKEENLAVIDTTAQAMKPGGRLLIDFLNPYVVINHLVKKESKFIENIHFKIEREYTEDEFIVKNICVDDGGKHYDFQEKVKAIRKTEFLDYFEKRHMKVIDVFGDYQLNSYQKEKSGRLIFILEK